MKKPIYERILLEAEADAKALLSDAEREGKALIKTGKEKIIAQNKLELEEAAANSKARIKNFAERQEKGLITFQEQARQQLVVSVFSEVSAKLAKLEGKDLLAFVTHLISSEKVTGNEVMQVSKQNYKKYGAALGADLSLLNKMNAKYKFTLSKEPTHIAAGFLLAGPAFDLMFDFNEIVATYQKVNEQRIYHELFKDE